MRRTEQRDVYAVNGDDFEKGNCAMAWETVVKVRKTGKKVEILINENGGDGSVVWEPFLVMTKDTAVNLAAQLVEACRDAA